MPYECDEALFAKATGSQWVIRDDISAKLITVEIEAVGKSGNSEGLGHPEQGEDGGLKKGGGKTPNCHRLRSEHVSCLF